MSLEHVNLTVGDLNRSIAFYCNLLDLHLRWRGPIDREGLGAHVGDDRCHLALFRATADGTVERDYQRSDFMWHSGVMSAATIAVAMTVFFLLAAFSPQITVDVPGIGRCQGPACATGGD